MNSQERHEARYRRRVAKRKAKKEARAEQLGGVDGTLSFNKLFFAGKKCCRGVRWKTSVQNFEAHLFSKTAVNARKLREGKWKPRKYISFTLCERGKVRPIDAPNILDRQIYKALTENVLLPLYKPDMIYNNGASLKGKGLSFSQRMLTRDLQSFVKQYGRRGYVLLLDLKQFFPSIPHKALYDRHERLLLDSSLNYIADQVVASNGKDIGMPLGVEPSQIEMVSMLSAFDNYIKCQLSIKHMGHYMDDYYLIVPPKRNVHDVLRAVSERANKVGITISTRKTKIVPVGKPFRYCKAKYTLSDSGAVIINGCRDAMKRYRRKLKVFASLIDGKRMDYLDLWASVNSTLAYYSRYRDHGRLLKARRLFYGIFGFEPNYNEFRRKQNELCSA